MTEPRNLGGEWIIALAKLVAWFALVALIMLAAGL